MLQRVAVCCSVLQYVAVCCIVLQCVAVCCSGCRPTSLLATWYCGTVCLLCVAVCCNVLQCVAVGVRPTSQRYHSISTLRGSTLYSKKREWDATTEWDTTVLPLRIYPVGCHPIFKECRVGCQYRVGYHCVATPYLPCRMPPYIHWI